MTGKRRIMVQLLLVFALAVLFALPMMWMSAIRATADETAEAATAHSQDYVFFVVEEGDVPLAEAPSVATPSYVLWVCLASSALMILFIYTGWYLTVQKNIRELSGRLLPSERRAFYVAQGFLHPIKCYQLSREAEDRVASIYNYF